MPAKKSAASLLREKQFQEITEARNSLASLSSDLRRQQETLELLQSVSAGLYEEIDKLAKKSPADEVSTLVLGQVNDVIRESKSLVTDDPFMKGYAEFVPAGDNPEQRDVVVVLRQVRQGLERFKARLVTRREKTANLLSDAKGIRMALLIVQEGTEEVTIGHLDANKVSVSNYWKEGSYGDVHFNLDLLDRTDIPAFFTVSE